MTLEDGIRVAAPLIQAIAVAVTAFFASKTLNAWRRQQLGKRTIEIAEEALVSAYKARSNLSAVRNPFVYEGEGRAAPKEGETEGRFSVYYVPLERMGKLFDDFAQFSKIKMLVQAYFGPDAGKPFDDISKTFHGVTVAARMLMRPGSSAMGRDQWAKWEATIWEGGGEPDLVKEAIDSAVHAMEQLCRPHLKQEETGFWKW